MMSEVLTYLISFIVIFLIIVAVTYLGCLYVTKKESKNPSLEDPVVTTVTPPAEMYVTHYRGQRTDNNNCYIRRDIAVDLVVRIVSYLDDYPNNPDTPVTVQFGFIEKQLNELIIEANFEESIKNNGGQNTNV